MSLGGFFLTDTLTGVLGSIDIKKEAHASMKNIAPEIQDYAQANAPWNDITGNARAGLTAEVDEEGDVIVLTLYHTVDYGIWLELIQNGTFAIIMPTLEHYASEVMHRLHATQTGEDGGG